MSDKYILDESGEPQYCHDLIAWAQWYETADEQRIVARTEIDGVRISTVCLGRAHRFGRPAPPILWETMVCGGALDHFMDRYETREGAVLGHMEAVARVRATLRGGVSPRPDPG
mgnify:CR=1 FL=1